MTPYVINLTADPKDRKPYDFPYMHSWTGVHFGKILKEYAESVQRDPLIPGRGTAKSGHALLHCICLLLTRSGHAGCTAKCALTTQSGQCVLFDHLIGTGEQRFWNRKTEDVGGFEVDI
jgi:hypothetical protein